MNTLYKGLRLPLHVMSKALLFLLTVAASLQLSASSHREAPLISNDPLADNVDLYAFRSPDNPDMITLIATYVPFQLPQGGPNYYNFGENVRYEIHVDNDAAVPGDEIVYRFTFSQVNEDPTTFFYARLGAQNLKTTYVLERSVDGGQTFVAIITDGVVPPANVGPRTIESAVGLGTSYSTLFQGGISTASTGETVFAGPTDDPFFVDLGGIFDLGDSPRQVGDARDGVACMNVSALAIQVPIATLLKAGVDPTPTDILDPNFVIGVWASASRPATTTLSNTGLPMYSGDWVQVSRLGMPLTNEAVIPIGQKDFWNRITPYDEITDTTLDQYFYNPELALYMDDEQFGGAVPSFSKLRIQKASLGAFDFSNGGDGLFSLKGSAAVAGTALDDAVFGTLLLPGAGQPRSVDLWPAFHTGVPNVRPYQLATGKGGDPLAAGKPFVNNFLPNGGDMLRLNMAVPPTQRDDAAFSTMGLLNAAVLGLTAAPYNTNSDLEFIPNMDGFPNGRRLEDDVTRIELQAVSGVVLAAIGLWYDDYDPMTSTSPVTPDLLDVLTFTTNVENNDRPFTSAFPYLAEPFRGTGECGGKVAVNGVQPGGGTTTERSFYVSSNTQGRVGVYNRQSDGTFTSTNFAVRAADADGIFFDDEDDMLYQINRSSNVIDVYGQVQNNLQSSTPPMYLASSSSDFTNGRELGVSGDFLVVAQDANAGNGDQNKLVVYERDGMSLMLKNSFDVDFNTWGVHLDVNTMFAVVDNSSQIAVIDSFFTLSGTMVTPSSIVEITDMVRTHGITYDRASDLMILTDVGEASSADDGALIAIPNWSSASADGTVTANEQARIEGPATFLGNPVDVAYDDETDQIYVAERANAGGRVLVFNTPTVDGDLSPVSNMTFGGASAVYVTGAVEDIDPVSGLIEVGGNVINAVLSPNPTSQLLNLQLEGRLELLSGATIRVFSMSGQQVLAKAWTNTDSGIDVSSLPTGPYVFTLEGDGFTYEDKFIKL